MRTILLLALVALFSASEARVTYEGYKVLRLTPRDDADLQRLRRREGESWFDIWNTLRKPGNPADIMVGPDVLDTVVSFLTERGLDYTVMIADVQEVIDGEKVAGDRRSHGSVAALADFEYDIYHDYDEIQQWVTDMASEHSDIVTKFTLTQSYENRDINGILIRTDSSDTTKPIVWFEGGIHAREWISPATVMFISKSLVDDYKAGDSRVTALLNGFDFHIVPSLNVDGFVYTRNGDRLWRKTRSRMPNFGCVGTDPNRNWPYGWGGRGASPWPCTQTFRGPEALSEVEIKGVVDYLMDLKDSGREIKMFIDWHSYSQLWLAPWSYSSDAADPKDWEDLDNLGKAAVEAIEKVHGTIYVAGASAKTLYEAAGASCDWAYATLKAKYSYVVELRDTGTYGFLLPADQIIPTAEEAYAGILAGLEYALAN